MEWIVKVEEKKRERLMVQFKPLSEVVRISGQYCVGGNTWSDFSLVECPIEDINLEKLQEGLATALTELEKLIEKYEDLSKSFKLIGSISLEKNEKSGGLMM